MMWTLLYQEKTAMGDTVYVGMVLALQAILIAYFALRRWRPAFAFRIGRAIYALGVPLALGAALMAFTGQPLVSLGGRAGVRPVGAAGQQG
jgi:hypothetical protein